jgi:predicted O-methyltransferase YrrM
LRQADLQSFDPVPYSGFMSQELWTTVERYFVESVIPSDPIQDETLRANAAAGLPGIDVAPTEGRFLYLLAKIRGAQRILEIGTLGGYSTIWLARALPPDGRLITLEVNAKHAEAAAANIARAGFSSVVEVRVGPGLDSLAKLVDEAAAPFDFIFIDADKPNNPGYLEGALRLSRSGTVIVVDNVVRDGAVVDPASRDASVQGVRALFAMLAEDSRLEATACRRWGVRGMTDFVWQWCGRVGRH